MATGDDELEGRRSWDALNERVANQGGQIKTLADDTAKQFLDFRESTKQQFAGFRSDVSAQFQSLNGVLEKLGDKFDSQSTNLAEKGRTNWLGLIGTGATAIGVSWAIAISLLGLRLTPIENRQNDQTTTQTSIISDLKTISNSLGNFETRAEISATQASSDAVIRGIQADVRILDTDKVSEKEMGYIVRERNGLIDTLKSDIAKNAVRLDRIEQNYVERRDIEERTMSVNTRLIENRHSVEDAVKDIATIKATISAEHK